MANLYKLTRLYYFVDIIVIYNCIILYIKQLCLTGFKSVNKFI